MKKQFKMLGLLAVAAALMAVGTASAKVTSPPGTVYNGTLAASSSNFELDAEFGFVKCSSSIIESEVYNGGTYGTVAELSFTECGNDTVTVLRGGTLDVSSSGSLRLSGEEITAQLHRTIFGVPVTTHCIWGTIAISTNIGTLTEGVAPAQMHIGGLPIPEISTGGACGNATLTGEYTVSTPSSAIVID